MESSLSLRYHINLSFTPTIIALLQIVLHLTPAECFGNHVSPQILMDIVDGFCFVLNIAIVTVEVLYFTYSMKLYLFIYLFIFTLFFSWYNGIEDCYISCCLENNRHATLTYKGHFQGIWLCNKLGNYRPT